MKFFKKIFLKFLLFAPVSLMVTACFSSQTINNQFYDPLLKLDLNDPGNTSNISVPIPSNFSNQANYIRNHAVSLFLHDKNVNNKKSNDLIANTTGNLGSGFIINAFSDTQSGGNEVANSSTDSKILVGVNLHVARQFFPNANLVDVNQGKSATLDQKNKKFNFGWINWDSTSGLGNVPEKGNYNLYLNSNSQSDSSTIAQSSIPENYFMDIPNNNVKLVYTATNLRINSDLFKIDQRINEFEELKNQFVNKKWEDISWVNSYNPTSPNLFTTLNPILVNYEWSQLKSPVTSQKDEAKPPVNNAPTLSSIPASSLITDKRYDYKFAVDFAVLEISVPQAVQSPKFKHMISEMKKTNDQYQAIEVNRGFRISNSFLTPYFVLGGFPALSSYQTVKEEVNNANPIFELANQEKAKSLTPTQVAINIAKGDNFTNYFSVSNLKKGLTTTNLRDIVVDDDRGSISFNVDVISANSLPNNEPSPRKTVLIFVNGGFKTAKNSTSSFSKPANIPPPRSGSPVSKYLEAQVNAGTFSDESIYLMANNLLNNNVYNQNIYYDPKNQQEIEIQNNQQKNVIVYGNDNFLAIGSKILTKGLNMGPGSSGSLAISDQWTIQDGVERTPNNLIGIYKGIENWKNPISQINQPLGSIILFSSPFRYDLFLAKNNLSYPSLCDVLNQKDLTSKLANSTQTCPVPKTSNNFNTI